MIDAIIGAKNEIIGGIVVALLLWCGNRFRALMKMYKQKKQELDRMKAEMTQLCATKEEHERLTAEIQRKDEALKQAEGKQQEDSRLIEKLKKKIPPMSDNDFLKLCKSGDAEKVEAVIMNGANVNARDNDARTALMWAMFNGNAETANLLRSYGAK